ncbi:MAG: hypothetical protein ACYTAQ_00395, partial [Planctomycetota bacterium]
MIASRMGTPAEISVPSVRVKRATDVFLIRPPSTGSFMRMMSVTARPGPVLRTSLKKRKARIGELRIHIAPGIDWPACLPATQRLMSISQMVSPGSSTWKSLKISWNFGITKTM